MRTVTLPGTDLRISRLSLGTAYLHHLGNSSRCQKLLHAAFELGFTHIDTAPYYGFGIAEVELGKFFKSVRCESTVATKIGLYPPSGSVPSFPAVWLRKGLGSFIPSLSRAVVEWSLTRADTSLHHSLNRLGRNCIDMLLLHEPLPQLINTDEFLGWLQLMKQRGKIRFWGLAGNPIPVSEWITRNNELSQILQVPDSFIAAPNFLASMNRSIQITYGALASQIKQNSEHDPGQAIREALSRNKTGTLLVSSRKISHLSALAQIAGESP